MTKNEVVEQILETILKSEGISAEKLGERIEFIIASSDLSAEDKKDLSDFNKVTIAESKRIQEEEQEEELRRVNSELFELHIKYLFGKEGDFLGDIFEIIDSSILLDETKEEMKAEQVAQTLEAVLETIKEI